MDDAMIIRASSNVAPPRIVPTIDILFLGKGK